MMPTGWKIDGFLDEGEDGLTIDGAAAVRLAEQHDTPLFVFSERRIRHNIDRIRKAETSIECPLKICYAAKANSLLGILQAVKDAGCDVEVNSGGELWKVLQAGFTGDQIVFNGTSKEIWELEMAIEAGIYAIQVDSLYELSLIHQTASRLGKRANVSLRLVPEIESGTHSGLQTSLLTSKFGMMPEEALSAFKEYKDSPRIHLCGLHLHIGSQNPDPGIYAEAATILFDWLNSIHRETGLRLKHLNLGGGFPVNYLEHAPTSEMEPEQQKILSADFDPSDALAAAWNELRAAARRANAEGLVDDLTLVIEPGRRIIADTGICLTTVRNHKSRPVGKSSPPYEGGVAVPSSFDGTDGVVLSAAREPAGDEAQNADDWLLTDAGFNILLSMETYKWYYQMISASGPNAPHDTPYKVAGPLCDGGDVYFDIEGKGRLPEHRLLPENARPGEVLALLNCGAYSLSQESQYNGRFRPAVVMIRANGEAELIRQREVFEDLIRNEAPKINAPPRGSYDR